jgi:hypothetical protein
MGQRGPKPKRADGFHVTRKGYLRRSTTATGGLKLGHVIAWESANGPVPDGYQIHHWNGDKQDNALTNLALVDALTHKRIHSGCQLRDGEWWKPCGVCGEFKPVGAPDWYLSPEGWPLYGRCRPCHIRKVVESKQLRRLR